MQTRSCKTDKNANEQRKVPPLTIKRKKPTLEDLRAALHTSVVPKQMLFREKEHETIERFLTEGFETGCSQAMYISGVPGTGKTASTTAVISELQKKLDFKLVTVNAMELIEPKKLFLVIHTGLFPTPPRMSAANARKRLNEKFQKARNKKSEKPVVVLIDELDMLCTRRQEILYDVFNWTALEGNRVQVLAISNTLDLPERVMTQKISSRLGTNRLIFQPYTYEQIQAIVRSRLGPKYSSLLHEQALEYAAKKVANISGDLRKVIDFLRRGVEIALEQAENDQVCFEHVQKAQKESSLAVRNVLGEALSRHAFLLFQAGLSQIQSSGDEEFRFHELYKQYRLLCTTLEGIEPLHDYGCWSLLGQLSSNRLISISPGSNLLLRKLRLGLSVYEAQALVIQVREARQEQRIQFV